MFKEKYFRRLVVIVLGLGVSGCSGCQEQDDEKRIVALVEQAAALAEQHDVNELMSFTTEDFTARPEGRDRRETKIILMMAFKRYGQISVRHPRPSVEVSPSRMTATVTVPFAIVKEGKEVPDLSELYEDPQGWVEEVAAIADPYHLKLSLQKRDGDWKVSTAQLLGVRGL